MSLCRLLPLALVLTALVPAAAFAQTEKPEQPRTAPRTDSPIVEKGPCFDTAVASMPEGKGHDHNDLAQHDFSCGFRQEAHLPLDDVLKARPDVMLGESDVKSDVAAVAVAYPEAGLLIFDVKDPAKPVFKSWYRGGDCDTLVLDTDCGAYVSLSDDGKTAFLSIQAASPLGNGGFNGTTPATAPGVQVISLDDPAAPLLTDFLPVAGVNGVHTANFHTITTGAQAGEYLFMTANSVGIQIARVQRSGGVAKLIPGAVIQVDEVHDTFIQEDPIDKKTYMYVAAGTASGFYVYDVTNPLQPTLVAEWDLRPECHNDWYAHTIDVTTVRGRRIVTMPAETFYRAYPAGDPEDCGEVYGSGDKPGPLWIVDATNLSKLGPADATDVNDPPNPELAANSKAALIATWHNAANAAGGDLKFSPHNQTIFGDRILLSAYHGGVVVLNAKAAFEGRHERPYEEAVTVPHSSARPIYKPSPEPVNGAYISTFFASPGDVWDVNYYKGYALAYDEHGGMYSYKFDPTLVKGTDSGNTIRGGSGGGCTDVTPPSARLAKLKLTRKGVKLTGKASDRACGKAGTITRVSVSVARKVGKKCAFLLARGKFAKPGSCSGRRGLQLAKGTRSFSLAVKGKVPRGRYVVRVEAADAAGNLSRGAARSVRVR